MYNIFLLPLQRIKPRKIALFMIPDFNQAGNRMRDKNRLLHYKIFRFKTTVIPPANRRES